ncbi:MAG: ATP-grasp domain-containing protein [Lachnospiraceae bacterium]|nr:ATP-grasp domain-containing protein [Lachnospiraceae bacterium]
MVILLTAIGKRVELVKHLKTGARVIGADASEQNAARYFTDAFYLIPKACEPEYTDALTEICKKENVDFLIPLHEAEFETLSVNRKLFGEIGTTLVLSDEPIIDICKDKFKTAEFFEKYKIPCPYTYPRGETDDIGFPVIVKPSDGMGSMGVFVAKDPDDLAYALKKTSDPIIQEKMEGSEFTMDVLCDMEGNIIYVVPRERLEVRDGEVNKSRVVLDEGIIALSKKVVESMKNEGGVRGPLTLQCFKTKEGALKMLEINPRFGGGVPLSFAAGADYARAFSDMKENKKIRINEIVEKSMLRFDESVFI